ncbi:basic proline-rich protein-like [Uloborus diversus]|uniref:basic proline-rich protein-like n=1 Tax=Uloborus diversus TaxID=327109 RepID=UPI002409724D|nr:basic proline-rich protein-like [Uloborus diversus]
MNHIQTGTPPRHRPPRWTLSWHSAPGAGTPAPPPPPPPILPGLQQRLPQEAPRAAADVPLSVATTTTTGGRRPGRHRGPGPHCPPCRPASCCRGRWGRGRRDTASASAHGTAATAAVRAGLRPASEAAGRAISGARRLGAPPPSSAAPQQASASAGRRPGAPDRPEQIQTGTPPRHRPPRWTLSWHSAPGAGTPAPPPPPPPHPPRPPATSPAGSAACSGRRPPLRRHHHHHRRTSTRTTPGPLFGHVNANLLKNMSVNNSVKAPDHIARPVARRPVAGGVGDGGAVTLRPRQRTVPPPLPQFAPVSDRRVRRPVERYQAPADSVPRRPRLPPPSRRPRQRADVRSRSRRGRRLVIVLLGGPSPGTPHLAPGLQHHHLLPRPILPGLQQRLPQEAPRAAADVPLSVATTTTTGGRRPGRHRGPGPHCPPCRPASCCRGRWGRGRRDTASASAHGTAATAAVRAGLRPASEAAGRAISGARRLGAPPPSSAAPQQASASAGRRPGAPDRPEQVSGFRTCSAGDSFDRPGLF